MNREKLYYKHIDILSNAYANNLLQHGNSCGCDIGNLIAACNGIELSINDNGRVGPKYADKIDYSLPVLFLWYERKIGGILSDEEEAIVDKQVSNTGYTWDELMRLEKAFESAINFIDEDKKMWNGLMRVIKEMDIIHENTDTEITTTSKQRFTKQLS